MARSYRSSPDEVISRRLDTITAKPGAIIDGADSQSRALALLSLLPGGSLSDGDARRAVARHLKRAGCKGWKCGYGIHEDHRAVRDELLAALGIGGDR